MPTWRQISFRSGPRALESVQPHESSLPDWAAAIPSARQGHYLISSPTIEYSPLVILGLVQPTTAAMPRIYPAITASLRGFEGPEDLPPSVRSIFSKETRRQGRLRRPGKRHRGSESYRWPGRRSPLP